MTVQYLFCYSYQCIVYTPVKNLRVRRCAGANKGDCPLARFATTRVSPFCYVYRSVERRTFCQLGMHITAFGPQARVLVAFNYRFFSCCVRANVLLQPFARFATIAAFPRGFAALAADDFWIAFAPCVMILC